MLNKTEKNPKKKVGILESLEQDISFYEDYKYNMQDTGRG